MLVRYFLAVFALTAPFLIVSATTGKFLAPGIPIAGLMVICPGAVALIFVWLKGGRSASVHFLARAVDFPKIRPFYLYLPVLFTCPAIALLCFMWMRALGSPVPKPEFDPIRVVALALALLLAAISEELGWSGFATVPLQRRMGPLRAGLALGVVWALWHYPALLLADRSIDWIVGWTFSTVAIRVVMIWVFNITHQSIGAVALFHVTQNLSWQLFPVNGSYFDNGMFGLLMALMATVVMTLWKLPTAPTSKPIP
jgi:membrane protease YdiL (CAAX protease family)